jgi:hypothetical protein
MMMIIIIITIIIPVALLRHYNVEKTSGSGINAQREEAAAGMRERCEFLCEESVGIFPIDDDDDDVSTSTNTKKI